MKNMLLVALMLMPCLASALPYEDGIVTVDDRKFFVGDLSWSFTEKANTFLFNQSPWLEEFLLSEPVLAEQEIKFLLSGIPAADLVGELPSYMRDAAILEDDPDYHVDDHEVFSFGDVPLTVFPTNSRLNYSVSCTRGINKDQLNICRVLVVYPYATNVVLSADQFFPGSLSEIGQNFEPIAARMIDIAICLDVTNEDVPKGFAEIAAAHPMLKGCTIQIAS